MKFSQKNLNKIFFESCNDCANKKSTVIVENFSLDFFYKLLCTKNIKRKIPESLHFFCNPEREAADEIIKSLVDSFYTNPSVVKALLIVRLSNRKGSYETAGAANIFDVFSYLSLVIKKAKRQPTLPSNSHRCLFYPLFSQEDLRESVKSLKHLIEGALVKNIRKSQTFRFLLESHKLMFVLNEKFFVIKNCEFFYLDFYATVSGKENHSFKLQDIDAYRAAKLRDEFRAFTCGMDSLCQYRHAMPLETKAEFLKLYNLSLHRSKIQESFFTALFEGHTEPYLSLKVRRTHLYEDALEFFSTVDYAKIDRLLKVSFEGEDGEDAGGIKKEFFQLISQEISRDTEIFTETTHGLWFKPGGNLQKLRAVGILVGVALYNDSLLNLPLSPLIFKKIKKIEPSFDDLQLISPETYGSLCKLRKIHKKDFEFMDLRFVYHGESEGLSKELIEDGYNISVDKNNCEAFIQLYADFVMNKLVLDEFLEFIDAFYTVISENTLLGFHYKEVEQIIAGENEVDFHEIKKHCVYEGFSEEDFLIQNLWNLVLNEFDREKQKKFLKFVTGSDRVIVSGSRALKLTIMKNGTNNDRLPSAQTCFNYFLIPEYTDMDIMKEKISKAIDLTEGFHLK